MRLWIVFNGEYSDRGIVGAFSSKEKAEDYIADHKNDSYYVPYIETVLDLDVPVTEDAGWRVWIDTQWRDGEERRERVRAQTASAGDKCENEEGLIDTSNYKRYVVMAGVYREQFATWAWGCDEERAKKIAYDRLAEYRYRWEMEHHS